MRLATDRGEMSRYVRSCGPESCFTRRDSFAPYGSTSRRKAVWPVVLNTPRVLASSEAFTPREVDNIETTAAKKA